MPDISKITLPSGNTYDIKDAVARELIAGGQTITAVYEGKRLVWEAGRCCFSKGVWLNEQPWKSELGWKNNA